MRVKLFQMLKKVTGCEVYQDFIPETSALPAISYTPVSRNYNLDLSGSVDLSRIIWQVSITSDVSRLDCDAITDKLLTLCNQKIVDGVDTHREHGFQNIKLVTISDAPRDSMIPLFTTNIDIEVTI